MTYIIHILAFPHQKKLIPGITFVKYKTGMVLLHSFFSGMESSVVILCILLLSVWSVALVAIANGRFYDNTTKLCWFFIVMVLNIIGILLFILWGRKEVDYRNRNASDA